MQNHIQDSPSPLGGAKALRKLVVDCTKDPFNPACCPIGPMGPECPAPPIEPVEPFTWEPLSGTWRLIEIDVWNQIQKEMDGKKEELSKAHGKDTVEYYSGLAQAYAEQQLPLQEAYARYHALRVAKDAQRSEYPRAMREMATALENVGSYKVAASYYAYLEGLTEKPSEKLACLESQIDCLQRQHAILISQNQGHGIVGHGQ
jgi:hypothetical protein